MVTMVLGGLWHGAAWTFVAWGALHGLGQVTGHWRRARRGLPAQADSLPRQIGQRVATFHLVCLGWVFFRATSFSNAVAVLDRLVVGWGPSPLVTPAVVGAIAFGIGTQYIPHGTVRRLQQAFARLQPVAQGALLGGALLAITTRGPPGVPPFIYYRF
ncbi:MAG: hypothetical protein ACRDZQ_11495 [Acidimicrobiales bacterium]